MLNIFLFEKAPNIVEHSPDEFVADSEYYCRIIQNGTECMVMQYLSLFLACVLAGSVVPFSSEVILSVFITEYLDQIWIAVVVASIGNTIGGLTGYVIGYFTKWDWMSKVFRISQYRLQIFTQKHRQKGAYLAFFSWLPFVGSLICLSLGWLRSDFKRVTLYMFGENL